MPKKETTDTDETITIDHPQIVKFYRERPHLNVTDMNLIFINIMEQLSTDLDAKIGDTIHAQILQTVHGIRTEMVNMNANFQLRLHEIKREYIDDVRLILSNTELTLQEKIATIIDKYNGSIVERTTNAIQEIVPKQNETQNQQIQQCIKSYSEQMLEGLATLQRKGQTEKGAEEQMERSLQNMFRALQQTVNDTTQLSETRLTTNLQQINEKLSVQKQIQETLNGELNSFLNKYRNNSSVKGAVSETELYFMLQKLAPVDEIIRCSGDTACCDIRLNRKDKSLPTILFESKDYASSVNSEEVAKFERDLQVQKCHGIFISQNSPITFKENYHIDVIGGIIHLYISNVKYDVEKVKVAIHIVDHLAQRLDLSNTKPETGQIVEKEEMEALKEEYLKFANQKNELIETIKTFSKQMTDRLDDIKLPVLKKLTGNNETNRGVGILCDICNNWWGKNQMSVSAHKKACAKKCVVATK